MRRTCATGASGENPPVPIDFTLDDELRAIAFAYVRQLRDRHGGRIPHAELSAGVTVRGQRVPIWNLQKGIFKPAVLGRDGAALSVQTAADNPYADAHDPDAGHFVYKYRGTDPLHADNVALRAAMRLQRPLMYLVAVDPGVYDAVIPVYVVGDDPAALQFILVADQVSALAGAGAADGAEPSLVTAARREYVTRAVMQRLHQRQFRRLVLAAYRRQCAICRLRHVELLDAAHILPDRDPRGEPLVTNTTSKAKSGSDSERVNSSSVMMNADTRARGPSPQREAPRPRECGAGRTRYVGPPLT